VTAAASAVEALVTANAGLVVPVTATVCGEFAASSMMEMISVRLPVATTGAKLTEIVQLAVGAIAAAQGPAGFTNSETFAPP
jgi:hypothetical protein